jgi:hypothetical protein
VNLFTYLKDIFVDKKGNLQLEEYIPYLITRWVSFSTPKICNPLNDTINCLGNIEKNIHYKLLISVLPKVKYQPRISYIKRKKKETEDIDIKIIQLAKSMELSQKEIEQLVELQRVLK